MLGEKFVACISFCIYDDAEMDHPHLGTRNENLTQHHTRQWAHHGSDLDLEVQNYSSRKGSHLVDLASLTKPRGLRAVRSPCVRSGSHWCRNQPLIKATEVFEI